MADDTMIARLSRLEDVAEIEQILVRYCSALDMLDDDLLGTVFHDDAAIDYGFFRGRGDAFVPMVMEVERNAGRRLHIPSAAQVQINGGEATVVSYSFAIASASVTPDPSQSLSAYMGMYLDRFERRDGRWAISARTYLMAAGMPLTEMAAAGALAELNLIGRAPVPLSRRSQGG